MLSFLLECTKVLSNMKRFVHRRMRSMPSLDDILAKSKQLLSSSPDNSAIPPSPIEDSDQVILTSISLPPDLQRTKSLSSDTIDILNEKSSNVQTASNVQHLSNSESSHRTKFVVTSPSNSDLSSEQNDSIDQLNSSSLSFLQTKHRRIDHRRNKSEPIKSASTENISSTIALELSSTSTTSNESPLSNNAKNQNRRKSSTKINSNNISSIKTIKSITQEKSSPSSTTTARKKKPWYNVNKIQYKMDTVRLFFNTKSFRRSNRKLSLSGKYSQTILKPDEVNSSNNNLSMDTEDNQSSSSDKICSETIKSFLSTHPSSTSTLSNSPLVHCELETCSGLAISSLSDHTNNTLVAPNVFELVSNARTFTNIYPLKRRRSLKFNNNNNKRRQRLRSSGPERNIHCTSPLLFSPLKRSQSNRYPDRIRKHSMKMKLTTEPLKRHQTEPFQSTYRQRNDEFRKIFKELPNDERLIVDYSCAWQKDILVHGRMYISQNYLCFYANILNWKSSLCLKFQDIVGITREKTAKVIPNAIEIKSTKFEKYFFASFVARDKAHAFLDKIWQNAINEQPISPTELWMMIHESYGGDLDMTTDEEDPYNKSSLNLTSNKKSLKEPIQSIDKYDLSNIVLRITTNSIQLKSSQQEDDRSSGSSNGEHPTDDDGIIPIGEESTTNTILRQPQSNIIKQNMNIISENQGISYLKQCPCQSHLATELVNRTYTMSVERLFDFIFGNNDFLDAYRAARRIKDFQASEWEINSETGKRERLCTYRVIVSAVIGSTTVCSNERQIIDSELSKSHYILDAEIRNEGIKYADAFFVACRYCLVQIGPNKAHLKITGEVRYVKSLMAIIKNNRIELSTLSGVLCDRVKRIDQESSKRSRSFSTSKNIEKENAIVSNTRTLQQQESDELTSSVNDLSINSQQEESIQDEISSDLSVPDRLFFSKNALLLSFCILTMFILLVVNIFLCVKLNRIDNMTEHLIQIHPTWLHRYTQQQEENEWSSLLKRQEEYYQSQINNLQSVLVTTHNALKNVTNALHELSKLSSRSN
ncbi:unnamed protein product [Rotaria sordida]|uniref:VASt domain-containing protein n=1 Tax=Rotaria sordida TaxID=392033 RepID=A0A818YT21_9BILA|nr:unnamed protein product [Rotaria sordida]